MSKIFRIRIIFAIGFLIFLSISSFESEQIKIFNIASFGAKGDGLADNSNAFAKCLAQAVKYKKCRVVVPFGNYRINSGIDFYFTDQKIEFIGILKNGIKPIIFSDNYVSLLSVRGYSFPNKSKGSISISNLRFSGRKSTFSVDHPFINKGTFFYGIYVADKSEVNINNVDVMNIYGQGINIINTKQDMDGDGRYAKVSISNSNILNCWGYNPTTDNYGDGIYVSHAITGKIYNNKIINDPKVVKQFGRAGIVLEYFADKITLEKNKISGYDRAVHVEDTNGGQQIIDNIISGTDLGLVIYENNQCLKKYPILIKKNKISNSNFPKSLAIRRVRTPRALINFFSKSTCRSGSVIEDNIFIIDQNNQFFGNSVANLLCDGLIFRSNKFLIQNGKIDFFLNYDGTRSSFINNTFDKVIFKRKFKKEDYNIFKENVFLNGGKIE